MLQSHLLREIFHVVKFFLIIKNPSNMATPQPTKAESKKKSNFPKSVTGCSTPIPLRTKTAVDLQGVPHPIEQSQLTEIEKNLSESSSHRVCLLTSLIPF